MHMYISTSYVIRATHAAVLRGWACDHRVVVCMYVCMYVCMCRCVSPIMVCGQHILRFDVLCACCDHCDHCVFVAIIAFCVIVVPMWYVLCVCCDHRSQCVFGAIIESSSCQYTYVHAAHIIALHASVFDHRSPRHGARLSYLDHRAWPQEQLV